MLGQLVPLGGGDSIPLLKPKLVVGRRESCDVVLRFGNVSSKHCELTLESGYWYVTDLQSSNGTKVNGLRVPEKRLDPGVILSVAKHRYKVDYDPTELGAFGPPPPDTLQKNIFSKGLLEAAGLDVGKSHTREPARRRFDVNDHSAGQIKDPNRPV